MKQTKVARESGKIYYQIVERGRVLGEENLEYKPVRVMPYGQKLVKTDEIAHDICMSTSLTEADVKAVLSALEHQISNALLSGNRVQLDEIGTLSLSLAIQKETKDGRKKPQKVVGSDLKAGEIKVNKVLFTPSNALREKLDKAQFVSSSVSHIPCPDPEEVDEWLSDWFTHERWVTRAILERTFGISQRSALNIIKSLVTAGKLTALGTRNNRFYIPNKDIYPTPNPSPEETTDD